MDVAAEIFQKGKGGVPTSDVQILNVELVSQKEKSCQPVLFQRWSPRRTLYFSFAAFATAFIFYFVTLQYGPEVAETYLTGRAYICDDAYSDEVKSTCLSKLNISSDSEEWQKPVSQLLKENKQAASCLIDSCDITSLYSGWITEDFSYVSSIGEDQLTYWAIPIRQASPLERYVFVEAWFPNPAYTEASETRQISSVLLAKALNRKGQLQKVLFSGKTLDMTVHCDPYEAYCYPEPLFYLNNVQYPRYEVRAVFYADQLPFEGHYAVYSTLTGTESFTNYMLIMKTVFASIALLAFLGYAFFLKRNIGAGKTVTLEQKWILGLLVLLIFYNDALFWAEIYANSLFLQSFSVIAQAIYVSVFFMFVLVLVHKTILAASPSQTIQDFNCARFYGSKALLSGLFLTFSVWAFSMMKFNGSYRPRRSSLFTNDGLLAVKIGAAIFLSAFILETAYYFIASRQHLRNISLSRRVLLGFTLASMATAACCVLVGATSPFPLTSAEWTLAFVNFNIFPLALAVMFFPLKDKNNGGAITTAKTIDGQEGQSPVLVNSHSNTPVLEAKHVEITDAPAPKSATNKVADSV